MEPAWLRAAIPTLGNTDKIDPCRRYVPIARTGTAADTVASRVAVGAVGAVRTTRLSGEACGAAFSNVTEECSQYMYPNRDLSIMTEVSTRSPLRRGLETFLTLLPCTARCSGT